MGLKSLQPQPWEHLAPALEGGPRLPSSRHTFVFFFVVSHRRFSCFIFIIVVVVEKKSLLLKLGTVVQSQHLEGETRRIRKSRTHLAL